MGSTSVDNSVNKEAVRALVTLLGPREAARQAGVNPWTVRTWCGRYGWKKAGVLPPTKGRNIEKKPVSVADAIIKAVDECREKSTLHLAQYTLKASKAALKAKEPLSVAKQVRDVASVYNTVWPKGEENRLIDAAILIGEAKVLDNVLEIDAHVRKELEDEKHAD